MDLRLRNTGGANGATTGALARFFDEAMGGSDGLPPLPIDYQTWTRFCGGRCILSPGCTLNALYQASTCRTTPLTRYLAGLCSLVSSWARSAPSRCLVSQL